MATILNAKAPRGGLEYAVVLALAMGGACSDAAPITGPGGQPAPAPAAPAPPPAPAPVGSWLVQGAIVEDLPVFPDVRPGPHVPVRVFGGGRVVETTSGADGSFEVVVPENAPFVRVVAAGPQYFTPCPGVRWGADARVKEPLEVIVVSGSVLSETGAPRSYSGSHQVWGAVFEQTPAGRQPISGATVTLTGGVPLENPLAATLTNARGLYDMCLPTRTGGYVVEVRKEGYAPASAAAVIGWDFETTDFVLTRR